MSVRSRYGAVSRCISYDSVASRYGLRHRCGCEEPPFDKIICPLLRRTCHCLAPLVKT